MAAEELLRPSYSLTGETMSALGVGPYAWMFNLGIFAHGASVLIGSGLLIQELPQEPLTSGGLALKGLGGVGAMLVGLFPEDHPRVHYPATELAFFAGALGLIAFGLGSYRWERPRSVHPYLACLCGAISLVAADLQLRGDFAGLGPGGMERLVVAPELLWSVVFGTRLIAGWVPSARSRSAGALGVPRSPPS